MHCAPTNSRDGQKGLLPPRQESEHWSSDISWSNSDRWKPSYQNSEACIVKFTFAPPKNQALNPPLPGEIWFNVLYLYIIRNLELFDFVLSVNAVDEVSIYNIWQTSELLSTKYKNKKKTNDLIDNFSFLNRHGIIIYCDLWVYGFYSFWSCGGRAPEHETLMYNVCFDNSSINNHTNSNNTVFTTKFC